MGNAVTGELKVVAEAPGRSIHRVPGTDRISFVRKVADDEWWIEELDPSSGTTERLTRTLPDRAAFADYAWTPDGGILMGEGETLHLWRPQTGWRQVADFSGRGGGEISRLAVSADGSRVAIVMNREDPGP